MAEVVADKLESSGGPALSADALLSDAQLRERDFAGLGLTSLDWMDVATRLEDALGVELPDELLLDAGSRSVAGWSERLRRLCPPGAAAGQGIGVADGAPGQGGEA
ncbi:MAG TPA: acyl carrier protein [Jatrophihabitans sp.]|nr:acyl carrier protein [Jatrophihabitans sp.]